MKIVPTPAPQKQEIDMEALLVRKAELKQQIQDQKQQLAVSAQHMVSPASFSTYIFRAFSKGLSMVDGVMVGFKIMRTIRGIFRR
ncbi:MAG: hypothetical protein QM800_15500 [Paludibacter sp.]